MKKIFLMTMAFAACTCILASCTGNRNNNRDNESPNKTEITMNAEKGEPIFGLGNPASEHFTGEAWNTMLSSMPENDCNVYNVTFAPGARNYWHAHAISQILLCTEGEGWYQEEGKPAQRLHPGDVVNIPANTMHWHGATAQSRFTHIGITPKLNENTTLWGDPVTDEEYNVLPE